MLFQMYRSLFESVETAKVQGLPNDHFNFFITLVGGCRRQFVVGIDRLLKGHLNDSYHFVRLAVEAACFAYKGYCHPHLIPVCPVR